MPTKICNQCSIEKDFNEFYKDNTRSKDGYSNKCKQCCSNNAKKRYQDNPEFRAKIKQWNDNNNGKWQKENFERHREDKMKWFAENPIKTKEAIKKFNKNHPEKKKEWDKINKARRKEAMSQLPYNFTDEEWQECKEYFNNRCAYCDKEEKLQREHFVSALHGGPFTKENIVPACSICNLKKGDRDFFEWYPKQDFYSEIRENKILTYLEL